MLISRSFAGAALVTAAAALALTAGPAAANPFWGGGGPHSAGAVFVQTDNLTGNAIDVYDRGLNGTLSAAGSYPTGGVGGQLAGSVVDHLASQNSLVYDAGAGELFAVNAGSNTISAFGVSGDRLQLRQVIGSGGSFPASIAVHGDLVYVLNALNGGEIQGFRLWNGSLTPIPGSARALGLNPAATPQFVTTPGDIAFTPNGGDLIVTTKNNTNDIDVFSVNPFGLPAPVPVVNSEPGDVPFGIAFQGGNQVDISEAGPNAVASFSLGFNGTLTPESSVSTGGAATCWLVADGPELYAGNAGSATESSVLDLPWSGLSLQATTNTDPGTVDAAPSSDGQYLYVQTGGNGIVDEFHVGFAGALQEVGSVTVPGAAGGEGIAAS
jgi:hypothetical protein